MNVLNHPGDWLRAIRAMGLSPESEAAREVARLLGFELAPAAAPTAPEPTVVTATATSTSTVTASVRVPRGEEDRDVWLTDVTKVVPDEHVQTGVAEAHARGVLGEGVIVGIVDGGVDVLNPAFLGDDGRTRIIAYWEPGDGTDDGELFDRDAIDAMVAKGAMPDRMARHVSEHGTNAASLIAGRATDDFPGGVAPKALMVVARAADVDGSSTSARVLQALGQAASSTRMRKQLKDVVARSDAEGLPVVTYFGVGTSGPAAGSDLLTKVLEENAASGPENRAFVAAAGNINPPPNHAAVPLVPGEVGSLRWRWDGGPHVLELTLPRDVRVTLRAPLGETGADAIVVQDPGGWNVHTSQVVEVTSRPRDDGDNAVMIAVAAVDAWSPASRWTLEFEAPRSSVGGSPRQTIARVTGSKNVRFLDHRPAEGTIGSPGASPAVLTVGAAKSSRSGRVFPAEFSAFGAADDPDRKPDLLAPGDGVTAAHGLTRGTTPAAAIAAGVVALLFSRSPDLSARALYDLLRRTARGGDGEWDRDLGYGLIDAAAALDALDPSTTDDAPSAPSSIQIERGELPAIDPILPTTTARALHYALVSQLRRRDEVDWEQAVERVARREPIDRLPRLTRWTTAARVVLIRDLTPRMFVFRADVVALANSLESILPRNTLRTVDLISPGVPDDDVLGRIEPESVVLVATDLDEDDDEEEIEAWRALAERLRRSRSDLVLLAPRAVDAMPNRLGREMAAVPWRSATRVGDVWRARRSKRAVGARERAPAREATQQILRHLSLAPRVYPALVRAMRRAVVPDGDAELDQRVWRADAFAGRTPNGAVWSDAVAERLRKSLAQDAAARTRAAKVIADYGPKTSPDTIDLRRLEAELLAAVVARDDNEQEKLWRAVESAYAETEGLAAWLLGVVDTIPLAARTRTAVLLRARALKERGAVAALSPEEAARLSMRDRVGLDEETMRLGVGFVGHRLRLGDPPQERVEVAELPLRAPRRVWVDGLSEPVEWSAGSPPDVEVALPTTLRVEDRRWRAEDATAVRQRWGPHRVVTLHRTSDDARVVGTLVFGHDGQPYAIFELDALADPEPPEPHKMFGLEIRDQTGGTQIAYANLVDDALLADLGVHFGLLRLSILVDPQPWAEVNAATVAASVAHFDGVDAWARFDVAPFNPDGLRINRVTPKATWPAADLGRFSGSPLFDATTGAPLGVLCTRRSPTFLGLEELRTWFPILVERGRRVGPRVRQSVDWRQPDRMFGREEALRHLHQIHQSTSGPRIVAVQGPPGIGKSALVAAWKDEARLSSDPDLDRLVLWTFPEMDVPRDDRGNAPPGDTFATYLDRAEEEANAFLRSTLDWFDETVDPIRDPGAHLALELTKQRAVLILDGASPATLEHLEREFLERLEPGLDGLVVVTTERPLSVKAIPVALDPLDSRAVAQMLSALEIEGVEEKQVMALLQEMEARPRLIEALAERLRIHFGSELAHWRFAQQELDRVALTDRALARAGDFAATIQNRPNDGILRTSIESLASDLNFAELVAYAFLRYGEPTATLDVPDDVADAWAYALFALGHPTLALELAWLHRDTILLHTGDLAEAVTSDDLTIAGWAHQLMGREDRAEACFEAAARTLDGPGQSVAPPIEYLLKIHRITRWGRRFGNADDFAPLVERLDAYDSRSALARTVVEMARDQRPSAEPLRLPRHLAIDASLEDAARLATEGRSQQAVAAYRSAQRLAERSGLRWLELEAYLEAMERIDTERLPSYLDRAESLARAMNATGYLARVEALRTAGISASTPPSDDATARLRDASPGATSSDS